MIHCVMAAWSEAASKGTIHAKNVRVLREWYTMTIQIPDDLVHAVEPIAGGVPGIKPIPIPTAAGILAPGAPPGTP